MDVKQVGCVGICNQVPLMEIHKPGEIPAYYTKIQAAEVKKIINKHFKPAGPIEKSNQGFIIFLKTLSSKKHQVQ